MDPFTRRVAPPIAGRRHRQACATGSQWTVKRVVVYTLVAAVAAFAFVQLFTKVYQPYAKHLVETNKLYAKSVAYITSKKNICEDTDENNKLRLMVGDHYDKCEAAQAVIDSSPYWLAFGNLVDDFDFCNPSCFQVKLDLLSTLGIMFMTMVVGIGLILVLIIGGIFVYCYRTLQTEFDLPYRLPMIDKAATMMHKEKSMHKHNQTEIEYKDD
jgi:hypothetical protein